MVRHSKEGDLDVLIQTEPVHSPGQIIAEQVQLVVILLDSFRTRLRSRSETYELSQSLQLRLEIVFIVEPSFPVLLVLSALCTLEQGASATWWKERDVTEGRLTDLRGDILAQRWLGGIFNRVSNGGTAR
jgi:hypothetical protein